MKYLFLVIVSVFFTSCIHNDIEQKPYVDYTVKNEAEIKAFVTENKLVAKRTDSGLYYVINQEGTGKQPTANSNVTVVYKGYFTNKTVFDKSTDSGLSFNLQGVIKGWTEGIPYFKEGGSGMLLVPSHLGYGIYDNKTIPGGSVLVFDVKLISVN